MRWSASDLSAYLQRRGQPTPVVSVPRRRRPKLPVGQMPQQRLAAIVEAAFPGRFRSEVGGLVPGRRYRADLANVGSRGIIECDGWTVHGKHIGDFRRDRERDYEFTVAGYRILRIPAGLIAKHPEEVLERVNRFVEMLDGGSTGTGSIQ